MGNTNWLFLAPYGLKENDELLERIITMDYSKYSYITILEKRSKWKNNKWQVAIAHDWKELCVIRISLYYWWWWWRLLYSFIKYSTLRNEFYVSGFHMSGNCMVLTYSMYAACRNIELASHSLSAIHPTTMCSYGNCKIWYG